jgi:hypothetical protein
MIEIYHGLYPLLPVENINNDTLEYSRVKATMVYIFCALAESLIFLLHLINTNKIFGVVAGEAFGVRIPVMILISSDLVYH